MKVSSSTVLRMLLKETEISYYRSSEVGSHIVRAALIRKWIALEKADIKYDIIDILNDKLDKT